MERASLLAASFVMMITGLAGIGGVANFRDHAPLRNPQSVSAQGDPLLETTLANTRNLLLSKRKTPSFSWDESMNDDVSVDALVLALGVRLGKLTPDSSFAVEVVRDILSRMSENKGWTAYPGGPINPEVTAIALYCLKEAGVGRDDPRIREAWQEFERRGGMKNLKLYAQTFLSLVGVFPGSLTEVSPKFLGLSDKFPINVKKLGIVGDVTVPIVALSYLSKQADFRLASDRKPVETWLTEEVRIGDSHAGGKIRRRDCNLPDHELELESLLSAVQTNADQYRDCVFLPKNGKKPTIGRKFIRFLTGKPSKKLLSAFNFIIDRVVSGDRDYWVEQAVIRTLQNQSAGGGWYSALTTIGSVRLLQEAQRVGLGNFRERIDRGWDALRSARRLTSDGYGAVEFMYSGTWDTASALASLSLLNGTPLEVSADEINATSKWLIREAVWKSRTFASWSFDQTAKSPDVDTTAYVVHALAESTQGSDPEALQAIHGGLAWILAQQNKDGGFAVWQKNGKLSPFVSKMYKLVFSGADLPFQDLSQSDVTGRVLTMLASIGPLSGENAPAVREAIRRSCDYLGKEMPKVKGLPVRLQSGTWMSNYVYSAAVNLSGLAHADCYSDVQDALASWIVSTQHEDGGWGESNESYDVRAYVSAPSTLSQTATALIGLEFYYERLIAMKGAPPEWLSTAIARGVRFLESRSESGMRYYEKEFTGVVLKGNLYCRYELVPIYTSLFVLAKWKQLAGVGRE